MTEKQGVVSQNKSETFWQYVKKQYKKSKLAVWSFYIAVLLAVVALFADFLANEKPIIAQYKGSIQFPILKQYGVSMGLQSWSPEFQNVTWKNLEFDWAVFPLVPYLPQNLSDEKYISPFATQTVKSLQYRHWLGTDKLGRDVLAGMIHGARVAFLVGILSMSISAIVGIILGALAGFFGDNKMLWTRTRMILNVLGLIFAFFYAFSVRGYILSDSFAQSFGAGAWELSISILIFCVILFIFNMLAMVLEKIPFLSTKRALPVDLIITRIIEIIVSVPRLILIMSIIAIVKPSIFIVMTIIGLTSWTGIARFIRAELLKVRNLEYIEAAESLGYSNWRILFKHAIPNALSPVFISIAFGVATAILTESTLSFLGIGVSAETVTWGSLLGLARSASSAWWLALFPGFAIFLTVTVFNLIGEGLTDALDPRLKE